MSAAPRDSSAARRSLPPPAALLIGTAAVGAADGKSMFRTNHYQSRADHRLPEVRGRTIARIVVG